MTHHSIHWLALSLVVWIIGCVPLVASAATLRPRDILVTNNGVTTGIIQIDPDTGEQTVVSGLVRNALGNQLLGSGPIPNVLTGMAVDDAGKILVADQDTTTGTGRILKVDPTTGNRTVLSSLAVGSGPSFTLTQGIALEPTGKLLITDQNGRILRVDPASGNRTIVTDTDVGEGPCFCGLVTGLTVSPQGTIYAASGDYPMVFEINPQTGDRVILAVLNDNLAGIAVDFNGDLLASSRTSGAIFRIDPVTGDSVALSAGSPAPDGSLLNGFGIALDADRSIVEADVEQLSRIDPLSGARELIAEAVGGDLLYNRFFSPAIVPAVPGDANFDDLVNGADYLTWANHFQEPVDRGARDGDFNGDGFVDGVDYIVWANNFTPLGSAVAPVPEPSTWTLIALGAIGVTVAGRTRMFRR